ncbi:MAG: carbohydrate porin [Endomicrobium sp.]|jgi:hypothetical protein|nr:carbohydrate porin [Endomicrobium sp.]
MNERKIVNLGVVLVAIVLILVVNVFADIAKVDGNFSKMETKEIESLSSAESESKINNLPDGKICSYGTFLTQVVPSPDTKSCEKSISGSFEYGLSFTKNISPDVKVCACIGGNSGCGLNGKSYLCDNSDIEMSALTGQLQILEFLYECSFLEKRLSFSVGKLNPYKYFDCNSVAGDSSKQFLSSMFNSNAVISLPLYNLGVKIIYSPSPKINFLCGCFNGNRKWNALDANTFNIVEADLKMNETGNYRCMCWGDIIKGMYGLGLSFDQSVCKNIVLFMRCAYQNRGLENNVSSNSWSFGTQIHGDLWHRKQDNMGAAVGQIFPLDKTEAEVYYNFQVTKTVAVSPIMQYIVNPDCENVSSDIDDALTDENSIFVFTLRTKISL